MNRQLFDELVESVQEGGAILRGRAKPSGKFDEFPGKMPGWALDLPRAVASRPWWARLLFWLALGEFGRHEFWGLAWSIQQCGLDAWEPECEWRSESQEKMPMFWVDKVVKDKDL